MDAHIEVKKSEMCVRVKKERDREREREREKGGGGEIKY